MFINDYVLSGRGSLVNSLIDGIDFSPFPCGYFYFCPNCEDVFGDGDVSIRDSKYIGQKTTNLHIYHCPWCGNEEHKFIWINKYELTLLQSKKLEIKLNNLSEYEKDLQHRNRNPFLFNGKFYFELQREGLR